MDILLDQTLQISVNEICLQVTEPKPELRGNASGEPVSLTRISEKGGNIR